MKIDMNELIKKAKEKGLIKTYYEFLNTEDAKKYCVSEEETKYYLSLNKNDYNVGDIVFVSNYNYKNGNKVIDNNI